MALEVGGDRSSDLKLLEDAKLLRDHMIRSGIAAEVTELSTAIRVIEDTEGEAPPEPAAVDQLILAFGRAHHVARDEIDEHTLNELLLGNSPYSAKSSRRFHEALYTGVLTAIALVLIALVLHFTVWSSRASAFREEAEIYLGFDHLDHLMGLRELRLLYEVAEDKGVSFDAKANGNAEAATGVETVSGGQGEARNLFMTGRESLALHYQQSASLPIRAGSLIESMNPLKVSGTWVGGYVCPLNHQFTLNFATNWLPFCQKLPSFDEQPQVCQTDAPYGNIDEQLSALMCSARWPFEGLHDYAPKLSSLAGQVDRVSNRLQQVQRFYLPMIFGTLGAVVYCMWRSLSPGVTSFTVRFTVLRMAFSGLAALTLSLILLPSNALVLGSDASGPLIYLMAFVFGYSVDIFVTTLNGLNSYFANRLKPKGDKKPIKSN